MDIPIPSSPPPATPPPNPFVSSGPFFLTSLDNSSPSLASTLPPPTLDASSPQLSIAEFYGAISTANIGQKLQEFLDQMSDPEFRKELMKFAQEQAGYMADIITLVYRYDNLANQLKNLDLHGKADKINNKLDNFLNSGGGVTADNAAIATFNTAINTYNGARIAYENALSAYQTALNNFEAQQNTYNSALTTWNNALAAYQLGTITQADLETARAAFQSAQNQFENVNKPAFNSAQSLFDTAKTNFQNAVTAFNTARTTYNNYVATRVDDFNEINTAISEWNDAIATTANLISQMNAIRSELGLTSVVSTGNISLITGLSNYGFPSGPNTLRDAVQADVDQDNASATALNSLISAIDVKITAINAGGYNPPLTTPPSQGTIPSIPTVNSGTAALLISPISVPTSISIQVPDPQDLITDYLLPRLSILEALKIDNEKETLYRIDVTDEKLKNSLSGRNVIGGTLGSSLLGISNAGGIATSPFLSAILSKHAFEAFFNIHGVPEGSSLVDQLGALYNRITTNMGLLSAGPAQKILDNAVITEGNGKKAIEAAVALGNVSLISELAGSEELRLTVAGIVNSDPTLSALTEDQKNALIDSIVGELGASLNRAALNELARALGLPGLMPQILAKLAGIVEKDPLASFSQQLFRSVVFANELAKAFQISESIADDIVQKALIELKARDQMGNNQAFHDAAIQKFITDELEKQGQVGREVTQRVQEAATAADERVKQEAVKSERVKTEAFREGLLKGLAALEFDPAKADLIASQIPLGTIDEIRKLLVDKGLTWSEANQIAASALNIANAKDASINPLSSFLLQQLGTTTEMAGLFKAQIVSILSPAVGMRQALQVAEDYGALIFTKSNSITNLLQVNERRLDAISYFIYDNRIYENYREATKSYISPQLAEDSPLKLGMTLLLTGIPGGLSNQGLTSVDNTLGPSANRSKHATSYPGILG